jgi:hypothetical protein
MSAWWLLLLLPGFLIEAFFALELLGWKNDLGRHQQEIENTRRRCYACVTGSSVTSFTENSVGSFCEYHRAHWFLINDLEKRALDGPA